jgi:hypothetical protein
MIFIIISFAKRISAKILHFSENLEITRNNRERATSNTRESTQSATTESKKCTCTLNNKEMKNYSEPFRERKA